MKHTNEWTNNTHTHANKQTNKHGGYQYLLAKVYLHNHSHAWTDAAVRSFCL